MIVGIYFGDRPVQPDSFPMRGWRTGHGCRKGKRHHSEELDLDIQVRENLEFEGVTPPPDLRFEKLHLAVLG
jgi:hypothetical protein